MAGKKRSGLLRKPHSITTDKKKLPKSFKPQQARQLIRRYHVLHKNKQMILSRLNESKVIEEELSIDNYKRVIGGNKHYKQGYEELLVNRKKNVEMIRIENKMRKEELIKKLGEIDKEVDTRGGLAAYQIASTQGQDTQRGGDSLKKLIEWMKGAKYQGKIEEMKKMNRKINALEIGSLSANNMISTSKVFEEVKRIDLNSQNGQLIEKQDFMQRPLPKDENEKFNMISCSLVLNFVPSAISRGDMLKRITKFLKTPKANEISGLFLVLPLPCINNSRYFDKKELDKIMLGLGFKEQEYYQAKKVAYWLYDWQGEATPAKNQKKELHKGSNRNNFCILIK
ncbi:hypothetical protein HYPBUDRAFT_233982 [Hyphopichia burtonii NRRL Y-1933]|uniref:25S rRNA adenine-N(1) methyltransferase n=1 Tax=Hyphopichia burtonii NRRL Y-1933 TaxID=984485 RepID=A0A1E4RCE1_9ASCO|nr:hypothetical protein HYPBUDRAFT_233982 [Hyphopichia burtonii NRRL Y-1933]ODV64922.1 hypothetical protein HYPBUDRAFT_233982 [Hyphopichia burtonii NRRL Y-1933]